MTEPNRGRKGRHPIFRAWRKNPVTGEKEYPPPGKRCWVIWIESPQGGAR